MSGRVPLLVGAALVAALPGGPVQAQQRVDRQQRSAIATAAARVAPSVVSVNVVRRERRIPRDIFEQMLIPRGYERMVEGLGTGFLVSADGLVITNQHVTNGAEQIIVTLRDGRDLPARLLGEDDQTDIAVLKLDTTGLPVAPIGRSAGLQPGDWVVAIGNPYGFLLGDPEPTVTAGVVSAVGRDVLPSGNQSAPHVDMIQTDAAINPGNSGGPLVDADGEVVGVNTFILSQSGGSVGLGFAIPIERAMRVAQDIRAGGRVQRGWLGLDIENPSRNGTSGWRRQHGVQVSRVAPGGPAARAGLRRGDLIETVDGRTLRNFLSWERVLLDMRIGNQLRIAYRRDGALQQAVIAAAEVPSANAERVNLRALTLISVTPAIQAERQLSTGRGALVVEAGPTWQRSLGLQPGDVIIQINNQVIATADQVGQVIDYLKNRGVMRFFIARGDGVRYADLWGTPQ